MPLSGGRKGGDSDFNIRSSSAGLTNPSNVSGESAVRVDLGCGRRKRAGYIGIDRFALPGVDIVTDFNDKIPLVDDSVDVLFASHSLEHVTDLMGTMREIYRVCRDRARVTIFAPYSATHLNQANPYHRHAFNEHTARFFTNAPEVPVDSAEWTFPHALRWGLRDSDNSTVPIDLRCVTIRYSYFPAFRGLDHDDLRALRKTLTDVCDEILIHLIVVKSPVTNDELKLIAAAIPQEDHDFLARRQTAEAAEQPSQARANPIIRLLTEQQEFSAQLTAQKNMSAVLHEHTRKTAVDVNVLTAAIHEHTRKTAVNVNVLTAAIHEHRTVLDYDINSIKRALDTLEGQVVRLRTAASWPGSIGRRVAALRRIFRRPADLSPNVAPPFRPLLERAILSPWFTDRHRLVLSTPLRQGELVAYEAEATGAQVSRVVMAGSLARSRGGVLPVSFDIYDATANRVVAAGTVVATPLAGSALLVIDLLPFTIAAGSRCYVRLAGGPEVETWGLCLYELRSFSRYLGRTAHRGLFGWVA